MSVPDIKNLGLITCTNIMSCLLMTCTNIMSCLLFTTLIHAFDVPVQYSYHDECPKILKHERTLLWVTNKYEG